MIHGLLVKDGTISECDLKDELHAYYEALDCDLIDIVRRSIAGTEYAIVCDDEGLFKQDIRVSMVNEADLSPMLVGRLFICKDGKRGKLASLTADDVKRIKDRFLYGVVLGNW